VRPKDTSEVIRLYVVRIKHQTDVYVAIPRRCVIALIRRVRLYNTAILSTITDTHTLREGTTQSRPNGPPTSFRRVHDAVEVVNRRHK
jgi:hypothetical protein